jgi:hypothetical protein
MNVNILPVGQMVLAGASIEAQIMLRVVRSCILQNTDNFSEIPSSAVFDWREVQNLAAKNKLAIFVLRGLKKIAEALPVEFQVALEEHENATIQMNGANLLTLRRMVPTLESHGVHGVVLKGPVAQKMIHGDFFLKPSTDLDLLVFPDDYDTASRLIASNGFELAAECSTPWWSVFLGEQHFFSKGPSQSTIDLHHRIQQPGSPAPREPELFISQSEYIAVGSIQIRTLSRTNACLLSCMSLAKALIHREPAGGHVCDIAANVGRCRPEEFKQLVDDAGRQGLRNTLILGLRAADLLLGIQGRFESADADVLRDTSDTDLLRMILYPWSTEIRWPRRSSMLWDLCDAKTTYIQAISWKIGGDLCRQFYHPARSVLSQQ